MTFEGETTGSFFDGCVRTYGAATRLMGEVWAEAMGEPMGKLSGSPKSRFRDALRHYEEAIKRGAAPSLDSDLRKAAADDEVLRSLLDESLGQSQALLAPDVDDVPPNVFKEAIREEAATFANGGVTDVNLDLFLRAVVAKVVKKMAWDHRLNVGENRHFPRMFQWLREIQDETDWEGGAGLRMMNRSGSGFVAAYPRGPHSLKVRVNAEWL